MKRVFSLALAALLLAGCSAAPAANRIDSSAVTAETSATQEPESTAATPAPAALHPLWAGDETQFYMVEMVTGELIRYRVADLVHHRTDIPCDVEGCTHDSESCPAVFRRGECDKVYVLDENTLVALTNNQFPETEDSQLVLLDRDCQNRRVVATMPNSGFLSLGTDASSVPYTDGQCLYCFGWQAGQAAMFRIDPETGEVTNLLAGVDAPIDQFLGAVGSRLLFVQWERADDPGDMFIAPVNATVHWVLDPADGSFTQLARYVPSEDEPQRDRAFGLVLDDAYYQVDLDAAALRVWEPETGNFRLITDSLPESLAEGINQQWTCKVQDWLLFNATLQMVNVQTGEVRQKPTLPDNYWNGGAHQPNIYLNLGDTLLVDCRHEPYTDTVIGTDGTPYTIDTEHNYLGLISAEDFLSGVPNYTEVGEYTT